MTLFKISVIVLNVISICCNAYWGYKLWKEKCYWDSIDCFKYSTLSCVLLGWLL